MLLFPFTVTESATSAARPPLHCSEAIREDGQIVALPAGRTAQVGLSTRRWTTTGQPRLTINLPAWSPTDDSYGHLRLNGESQMCLFSPKHPTVLLVLPQIQHRMLKEGNRHSFCNPALRESTPRRPTETVDLQALINQWGDSSLEELETFIDSYFETVWEQAMAESDCSVEQDTVIEEPGEEVLSSIDRKLSKLDLLEEIRRDLAEVKKGLEHSWKAIQELKEKSKQDVDNTC